MSTLCSSHYCEGLEHGSRIGCSSTRLSQDAVRRVALVRPSLDARERQACEIAAMWVVLGSSDCLTQCRFCGGRVVLRLERAPKLVRGNAASACLPCCVLEQ